MNRQAILWGLAAVLLGGCAHRVAWVIKPVPIEEELIETVVSDPGWPVSDKVVLVDVDGVLENRRRRGLLGLEDNPVSLFVEKLNKAADDDDVRAVVLRINSPGGGVTATDIMYRRVLQFRRDKAPVVAIIEDVGASGGYYLACGARRVIAHPTSVVGSIGVIMHAVSFAGTMEKIGVSAKAITSGPYKDLASPLKPLDDKDLAVLREMIDVYHRRFLLVVGAGRTGLKFEQIEKLADGRVYTGQQAKKLGLVDETGYTDDAVREAMKLAGIDQARVVMYHRPFGQRTNIYSNSPAPSPELNLAGVGLPDVLDLARPRFLYLWSGRALRH